MARIGVRKDSEFDTLVRAAREMLKFGQHEGACDNGEDWDEGPCTLHVAMNEKRREALKKALEPFGGVDG
jgi:hypothetical protein